MNYREKYKEKEKAYLEAQKEFWDSRNEWLEALQIIDVLEYFLSNKKNYEED